MSTNWSQLYASLEKEEADNPLQSIRVYPYDEELEKFEVTRAERGYYLARMKVWSMLEQRRQYKTFKQVLYQSRKRKSTDKTRTYTSWAPYIFLQYMGILQKWAKKKYRLKEWEINMILYLYPIGIFDQNEFELMYRAITEKHKCGKAFGRFKRAGRIVMWKRRKKGENPLPLYCLSEQMKDMCSKFHTISLGKEPIPETFRNPLTTGPDKKLFTDILERMNERLEE